MRTLGINDLELVEGLFARLDRSPFYVKDRSLRYRASNDAMARLCGAPSRRAMIGRSAADYFPASDVARYEALECSVLESGQPLTTIIDYVPGSDPEWLVYSHYPLFDADGSVVGVAGTSTTLRRREFDSRIYRRVLLAGDLLRADLARPLRVAELSEKIGVSAAQLQRDFRRVFGMTPRQFLMSLKLAEARRLLLGNKSVAVVAQEVGFADQSAFTRRFRTAFGLSPTEFRNIRRSTAAPKRSDGMRRA